MSAKIAQHLPVFPLAPEAVHVIGAPAEFREALSQGIRKARKRIVLASLYIGTSETRLVTELAEALAANADLELHVLVDFFRGHRSDSGGSSTATMLDPLLGRFPGRRFNEVFGLQHIKAYVFDDDVIISGANLSSDYFTTRQDRYVLFKDCSDLASFFSSLVNLGVAGIRFDEAAMLTVFKELQSDAAPSVTIASGYLNIPDRYKRQLLESKADINIVCSSPEANGFFNSRGVSRYIPHAYSYLEFCFFRDLTTLNKRAPVRLAEYFRTGPLFHPEPSNISLQSYLPFKTYELVINFRNMDKFARKLRLEPIDSAHFSVHGWNTNSLNSGKVAPGMEIPFIVKFKPEENVDYVCNLVCETEREKFLLPIRAIGARGATGSDC
nr:CDP-diacylglycerol--glycerol-3-phosphate 3-phosphatidyltransferase [Polyrhizophydium stewartii]